MTQNFPHRDELVARACEQSGLSDFGETWFMPYLDKYIECLQSEAQLSEAGHAGTQASIISALSNRLRHVELVKNNPDIKDEEVNVSAIVVGLPRTGSTMIHRMLSSAKGMTAVKWFEAQNYTLLPGEERGDPTPRLEAGQMVLDYMLQAIPEIMSIHPMSLTQADEEVIILGQLFSSTMLESSQFIPTYAKWLMQQDRKKPYLDLHEILQSFQWQDPSRKGASWVLKTPGHLMALDAVLEVYPDAKIVMTHRDPVDTVPSYCSMMDTLYRMGSNNISKPMIGEFWLDRLHEWTEVFMTARAKADSDRFIDVDYRDLLANPIQVGERVLSLAGFDITDDITAGMADWIEGNKREDRASHKYDIADFDLNNEMVKEKFATYRDTYIT
ncbi:MAG: sulfotransferase family protein [Parvibaculales bacterium]